MDTGDRIGLLPGFELIAGHSFFATLFLLLAVVPGGIVVIAPLLESRFQTFDLDKAFLGFFPGDVFLVLCATGLLTYAQDLPAESTWYNSLPWHLTVLGGCVVAGVGLTFHEWYHKFYTLRQIFSPSKMYHNIVLWMGLAYVVVASLAANLFGNPSLEWLIAIPSGLVWLVCVILDSRLGIEARHRKAEYAHPSNWKPIWQS